MKGFLVFDVESIGLHGEGFAVGFVAIDIQGQIVDEGYYANAATVAKGSKEGHIWVEENIPNFTVNNENCWQTRNQFWTKWRQWEAKGFVLIADCAWPVEARFLCACIDDHLQQREWQGPYPLHDLATLLLSKGKNPLQKFERLDNELPEHHPLMDARQSARILKETLNLC